jgi:6-phosphogluconolactonase (cycloisomerase 2 family)
LGKQAYRCGLDGSLISVSILLLTILSSGCGGGKSPGSNSSPSSTTQEFLYATGGNQVLGPTNQILGFTIDTSTGAIAGPTSIPGPNSALSYSATLAANGSARYLFAYDIANSQIDVYSINPTNGSLAVAPGSPFSLGSSASIIPLTGSLAADPAGNFLYVNSVSNGSGMSGISAFSVDNATGALTNVAGSPFSDPDEPAAIAIGAAGTFAYTINLDNTISVFTINLSTGALTPIAGSPFSISQMNSLPLLTAMPSSGKFFYAATESSVSAWSIDTTSGALSPVPGSPFAAVDSGDFILGLAVDPAGRFLYVSYGVEPLIAVFSIDPSSGALSPTSFSPVAVSLPPGNITIDPSGQFLCSAIVNTVSTFKINSATGQIEPAASLQLLNGTTLGFNANIVVVKP